MVYIEACWQSKDRAGACIDLAQLGAACEFRFNPATHSDLKPASVPI